MENISEQLTKEQTGYNKNDYEILQKQAEVIDVDVYIYLRIVRKGKDLTESCHKLASVTEGP